MSSANAILARFVSTKWKNIDIATKQFMRTYIYKKEMTTEIGKEGALYT